MNQESRKAGKLRNADLTDKIIGAAIAVHRELGPGFLESAYEQAMSIELQDAGLPFERQKTIPLFYKTRSIGEHRLDFLVANSVVVELKAIHAIEDIHFAVVRSYLKATACEDGLLLNFASMPLTIRRVSRERNLTAQAPDLAA